MKKTLLVVWAVVVAGSVNAQISNFYVKVNAGLQAGLGKVHIAGPDELFYGDHFIGGNRTNEGQDNTEFPHKRLGLSFGVNVAPRLRVGLGTDIDIYEIGGSGWRNAMPILLETDYVINERGKQFFLVYSSTGYSFPIEDATMGAVKLEGGLAYEFMPRGYTRMGFGARLGYSYLYAHHVHQYEMTHTHANSYRQTGIRFVKTSVHSVPLTVYVRF